MKDVPQFLVDCSVSVLFTYNRLMCARSLLIATLNMLSG